MRSFKVGLFLLSGAYLADGTMAYFDMLDVTTGWFFFKSILFFIIGILIVLIEDGMDDTRNIR